MGSLIPILENINLYLAYALQVKGILYQIDLSSVIHELPGRTDLELLSIQ
jgi:hypothetical protein